jgi:hypothetical protein
MPAYDITKLDPSYWREPYTLSLPKYEKLAYTYVRAQLANDRQYISLAVMTQHTKLKYEFCESMLAKFHADRAIPRMTIVEETEG